MCNIYTYNIYNVIYVYCTIIYNLDIRTYNIQYIHNSNFI